MGQYDAMSTRESITIGRTEIYAAIEHGNPQRLNIRIDYETEEDCKQMLKALAYGGSVTFSVRR